MIRRDYFLRMVQEMAQVLARAVLLKHRQEYDQALKEINDALRGLRSDSAAAAADDLSLEDWLELCRRHENAAAGLLVAVADLIKEQADLLRLRERTPESRQAAALSLGLFLEALVTGSTFVSAELLARVEELIEWTAGTLPAGVLRRLAIYHELRGRLDKAEDSFFRLVESGDGEGLTSGLAFYDRLAGKTDGELEEGGLSRAEVEEGRRQFLNHPASG